MISENFENFATASRTPTKADIFISHLTAVNAKKVALLLVFGFIVYHGFLNLHYGSDSCQWLLSKGRFKGDNEWQPYGCMMHKYSETDTRRCLRYIAFWGNKNNFVFIGDENIRLLYERFIAHLQANEADNDNAVSSRQSTMLLERQITTTTPVDAEFEEVKLNINAQYLHVEECNDALLERLLSFEDMSQLSSVYVVGFTYSNFYAGNVTNEILRAYTLNLTRLVVPFDRLVAQKSRVLWKLRDHVDEERLPNAMKFVRNDDIDRLNRVARNVFQYSDADVWEAAWHISNGLIDNAIDGHLLSPLVLRHEVQILLNMYCNDYMNKNDGTCCSSAEPYTNLQIVAYAVFGVCMTLITVMWLRRWFMHCRGHTLYMPLRQQTDTFNITADATNAANNGCTLTGLTADYTAPIVALAQLGLIMAYFYLCDRTNFFMKENKYYSEFSFWIPVGYVFVLGLFFTEDTRLTKVLNRDQTDEFKGWIMLVVLIYYMTGAKRVLPIHMHTKLLISGYLFLNGYTHFTHIWYTGANSSFVRFFQVMFRTNFLAVTLCFCMNRPYQVYYFVPLLCFWQCVIYFVLCLPPPISAATTDANPLHYVYLVCKFVGCLCVITILFMSEVFFERVFVTRPWKALFVTSDDDIHDWWYQWKLDRYTTTFGMIFAAFFHIAQKYSIFDDNNHGNLFARRTSIWVTLLAFVGVCSYIAFSFLCRNEQNCEEIHSYIVFIPIVGYIILRNISGILRTRYSTFFAWFGRISLELFICRYHIWLASDQHGVLVLLPGFPTMNMMITTFIFVCAAHEVHRLTHILLPYAVPNDWKLLMRNWFLFLLVLIPIGRSDGMF